MSYRPYHMTSEIADREESDEAFARRLHAQELGMHLDRDTEVPLIDNQGNRNPTVLNARYNEASNSQANTIAVLTVNLPQILAAIIVLSIHWNDVDVCDPPHTFRWKMWAFVSSFRMAIYSVAIVVMFKWKDWFEDHPRQLVQITSFRNIVDALGLVWFIVGNLWLFGDDNGTTCSKPGRSPIYNLCVSMVIVNYIQICLPCILAALLLPLFCFCMPCLIRILARINSRANPGATLAAISTLPVVIFTEEHLQSLGADSTCPICLSEIALGSETRVFRCKHIFHRQCVDEWLAVNASCPTCRKTVFPTPEEIRREEELAAAAAGTNQANASTTATGRNIAKTPSYASSGHTLLVSGEDQATLVRPDSSRNAEFGVEGSTSTNSNDSTNSLVSGNMEMRALLRNSSRGALNK